MVLAPAPAGKDPTASQVDVAVLEQLQHRDLSTRACPDPYATAGILRQLVRIVLDLARRLEALDGGSAAPLIPAARPVAEACPAPSAPRTVEPAAAAAARPVLTDRIEEILATKPTRWWSAREVCAALAQAGHCLPGDSVRLSLLLTKAWSRRGWDRRAHPMNAHLRQYRRFRDEELAT